MPKKSPPKCEWPNIIQTIKCLNTDNMISFKKIIWFIFHIFIRQFEWSVSAESIFSPVPTEWLRLQQMQQCTSHRSGGTVDKTFQHILSKSISCKLLPFPCIIMLSYLLHKYWYVKAEYYSCLHLLTSLVLQMDARVSPQLLPGTAFQGSRP